MKLPKPSTELLIAVLIILVTGWVFLSSWVQFIHPPSPPPTPTARIIAPPKEITASNLPLQEVWRWRGDVFSRIAPNLVVVDERIVVPALDNVGIKLIVLDAHLGTSIWESYIRRFGAHLDAFESLDADNKRVYVATSGSVQAFDIDNGQLLWTGVEKPWRKHGALNVYAKGNQLEAYLYRDYHLYTLEASTGETLNKVERPGILIRRNGVDYGEYRGDYVWARDSINQQLLWEQYLGREIRLWPIFIDDRMYFSAGADFGADNKQIFALSTHTGEIVWSSRRGFVSNVALSKDVLYAIGLDAAIVGLDPKTGQQLGEIRMTPPRTYQDDNSQRTFYTIAASEKYVAAYYYNSQEIIVFEQTDNGDN